MSSDKHWYALYVRSRSEKKVLMQLDDMGVEAFLPLITRIKQWSDRKKKVEEPLFKSYIFVHSTAKDHYPILNVYGVVKFVTFEHKAVVVPDNQIIAIKCYIDDFEEEESSLKNTELKEGQMVRITAGPMMGLIGKLHSVKDKKRLTVYIEAVGQYISVSIPRTKIEPITEKAVEK
jgi:transcription antitermination factor NusG